MPSAVDIRDLVVVRSRQTVLAGVTARIQASMVTGLLGPSGSGKTTLLRAIVGAQQVRSGGVTVLGHPAGAPTTRHRIGYVTQAPSIYSDLTVRENVRYFASLFDGVRAEDADAAVTRVGLAGLADRLVSKLSGGQRSRVSLACALVSGPELLVLDEPTVGQDPLLREELWQHFHDLAGGGCDRLILIRQGVVVAEGTPDEVREQAGTHDLSEAFVSLIRSQLARLGHKEVA